MNIFKIAEQKKVVADSSKRGNNAALKTTISIPYFKGLYRKGESYSIKIGKGKKVTEVTVKPLTGAFIISYATCLSACLVQEENRRVQASNFLAYTEDTQEPVILTTYLIEAVLSSEGFAFDDYAQGKTQGARRIEQHLKAIATQRELPINVENDIVTGVTTEIVSSVLSAI